MDRRSDWDVLVEMCNVFKPAFGRRAQYVVALSVVSGAGFIEGFTGINRGQISNEELGAIVSGGIATARSGIGGFIHFYNENFVSEDYEEEPRKSKNIRGAIRKKVDELLAPVSKKIAELKKEYLPLATKANHGFGGGMTAATPVVAASFLLFYGSRFAGQGARMLAENYHLVDKLSKYSS